MMPEMWWFILLAVTSVLVVVYLCLPMKPLIIADNFATIVDGFVCVTFWSIFLAF